MRQSAQTRRWAVLAAAVVGCVALSPAAFGQFRVNSDGHALDANNRVGGNGLNDVSNNGYATPAQVQSRVTANNYFGGNATGTGNYNGNNNYRDPYAFRSAPAVLPSQVLQQQTGPVNSNGSQAYNNYQNFGYQNQTPAVVPGYSQNGNGQAYIPPTAYQQPQDYRLGDTLNIPASNLPRPGQTIGAGPVDMTADMTPSFLRAAPINGASLLPAMSYGGYSNAVGGSVVTNTVTAGISRQDIVLRGELAATGTTTEFGGLVPANGNATGVVGYGTPKNTAASSTNNLPPGAIPGVTAGVPIQNQVSGTQAISSEASGQTPTVSAAAPLGATDATGQVSRQYLAPLPPAAAQSPQYAKLKEKLDQYEAAHPKTDEEANRLFQEALRARRELEQGVSGTPTASTKLRPIAGAGRVGKGVAGGTSGGTGSAAGKGTIGTGPDATTNLPVPDVGRSIPPAEEPPPPLEISSIGKNIKGEGLSKLVQDGEALAHQQKFKDAIAKFQDARMVAPNNLLIAMDLANAELGAGFYEEADQYLRDAFTGDPALLMGRYDLKSLLGDDRLQVTIADLKRVASSGESPTPVFLLAYLSYNTGESDKAVEYLKLAQARAGGHDETIRALGQHWSLPQAGGGAATQPGK